LLTKQGIELSQPHATLHFTVRSDDPGSSDVAVLRAALTSGRFDKLEESENDLSVSFSEIANISSMVFDRRTMKLNDFLHEHGWAYRGWKYLTDNPGN